MNRMPPPEEGDPGYYLKVPQKQIELPDLFTHIGPEGSKAGVEERELRLYVPCQPHCGSSRARVSVEDHLGPYVVSQDFSTNEPTDTHWSEQLRTPQDVVERICDLCSRETGQEHVWGKSCHIYTGACVCLR